MIRESIAYERDFKNGIEKEYVKHKPKNAMVKGFTTIELFDAETGEKTYEVLSENIINDSIYKKAYMDYLYYGIRNRGAKYNTPKTFPLISNSLILTDYTGVEDSTVAALQGNVIGYANYRTEYVGTDTKKGSINKTESNFDYFGLGTIKYVFDFPTNACNGTFRTVWWGDVPGVDINNEKVLVDGSEVVGFSCNMYNYLNTVSFLPAINKILGMLYSDTTKFNLFDVQSEVSIQGVMPKTYGATSWRFSHNNGATVLFYNWTTWVCDEYSVDMNLIKSYALTKPTGDNNLYYAYGDGTYIYCLTVKNSKFTVFKFRQSDCSLVSEYILGSAPNIGYNVSLGLRVNESNIQIYYGQNTVSYRKYDLDGNLLDTKNYVFDVGSTYISCFHINKTLKFFASYGTIYTLNQNTAPLAQNLLPAPVTKNATQTMKVTYTFNVEVIDGL